MDGLSLDVEGRVNFTFDSELEYDNNLITIKFSCSHEIYRISFTVLMIFEYPELYSVDIDEIGYGENSETEIRTENSIQPFLGLTGMRNTEYENGGYSFNILPLH